MMRMGRTLAGLALVAAALTITLAAPGFAQAQPLPRTLTPHAYASESASSVAVA